MIINFSLGNYRSFNDKKVLSMEAAAIKELKEFVIVRDGYKLLPSAVIYGANSSGKSNLLEAIKKFQKIIVLSSKLNSTDKLDITPFLLNQGTMQEPSFFEIEMLIDSQKYRYGFTVDNDKIYEEWLYQKKGKTKKEQCLFIRSEEGIGIADNYNEGIGLEERVRDNGLFLSVVDSFNGKIAQDTILKIKGMAIISSLDSEFNFGFTSDLCAKKGYLIKNQSRIQDFLKSMNVGFNRFEISDDGMFAKQIKAYTVHNLYDDQGNVIGETRFFMKEHESSGINKLFDLAILVIRQLENGWPLIIDELDSKFHPLLTQYIVKLFNNPETNPKSAQLIFVTYDTNLLNIKMFRRDQIWFTEKDNSEATDLYSLVEFREPEGNKIRKDRSFEKDYLNGRYGAIPYFKDFLK